MINKLAITTLVYVEENKLAYLDDGHVDIVIKEIINHGGNIYK